MSARDVVMLGTASEAPTLRRNQNACLLRWGHRNLLFDPGEGTQRQFVAAGLSAAKVERVLITHFHGDHCLGLPGLLMRIATDRRGSTTPPVHYPAGGRPYFDRLTATTPGQESMPVDGRPATPGVVHADDDLVIRCARLDHGPETLGYRVEEPSDRRFVEERLRAHGVAGPDIGRLRRDGRIDVDGRSVTLDQVTEERPGQVFAYVLDTRPCDSALELAAGADVLVCESTFLSVHRDLARESGHLTACDAGRLAREAGARRLVLTHFSRRYPDPRRFLDEARAEFTDVVVAEDLDVIAFPPRR